MQESDEAEERGLTGYENSNGTISKYWNPGGKRTKAHPKISEFIDDPALKSTRGAYMLIERDFQDTYDGPDVSREDVAMDLNSDDDKPDVMDKLNGILSRQSSEPGSDFRAPENSEYGRRRSVKRESRRESRDSAAHSPRRGRSKSPSNEDSTYGSYRSRTPSGGASGRKNRSQHPLPAKPDPVIDSTMTTPPRLPEGSAHPSTDYSPLKPRGARSRSASPSKKETEDERRRHRDYDIRSGDAPQDKGKGGRDSKKRRTSGPNGVPAVFG